MPWTIPRRPLVVVPPPQPRCARDWLAAWDDLLCLRVTHCTRCGQPCPDHGTVLVENFPQGLSVAVRLCLQCHRQPGGVADAVALLQRRYHTEQGDDDGCL
jgi:hypothetical protein